jgi:hypothetical protein
LTQPSPAKTWAQVLNSNPNAPSNTSSSATTTTIGSNIVAGGNNSPSSSSPPSSQHSITTTSAGTTTTKTISPPANAAFNLTGSRPGFMSNFYDQQQPPMNWPLNFNQSSWMMDDDSQRQGTNSSQQSVDNTQTGGDGMRFLFAFNAYS